MGWLENKTVRLFVLAAGGALVVWGLRELTVAILGEGGRSGGSLVSEIVSAKLLFTKMFVFFLGMAMAVAAFGKQASWKMLLAIVFLALLMRPLTGGAFGAVDRVILFLGLTAVVVTELDGNLAKAIGAVVGSLAVIMLGTDEADAFRRNGGATLGIIALFMAPTVLVTTFVMAGELSFAPIRRMVAKARA